jgi:putative ABC transport system permease protein
MNLLRLSLAGLRGSRLTHALNILILALGLGTVTLLLLFSSTLTERLTRDARGIDLVVGAKGSPLQLVLSTVFQSDIPTGNIPLGVADAYLHNPMVDFGVPLALGDAVGTFRIVGTTPDYLRLYDATLARGRLWQRPMEAVLGAATTRYLRLGIGDTFVGAHGVNGTGGAHKRFPYTVTGILAPTGSVIDRLVLTSVESVWKVHENHFQVARPREITALLLRVRTPLAIIILPHQINSETALQAAVPSFEAARLFSLLGFGLAAFRALAGVLVVSAGLGILIALVTRIRERRHELAVLRLLGASRGQLFAIVLIEAMVLAGFGAAAGLLLGHTAAWALAEWLPSGHALASMSVGWQPTEWRIPAAALTIGFLAATIPAVTAYRSDVSSALGGASE